MIKAQFSSITLIGVGGMGTPLLPVFAKLRPGSVTLYDDDVVIEENLETQFWDSSEVGLTKVSAAASRLYANGILTNDHPVRYTSHLSLVDPIVISAVDSMESRREVWRGVRRNANVELLIDCRLSRDNPDYAQLFFIRRSHSEHCAAYEGWLAGDGEPDLGRRDVDMTAAPIILSGLIDSLLIRWARGGDLPWQVVWDGISMSLISEF